MQEFVGIFGVLWQKILVDLHKILFHNSEKHLVYSVYLGKILESPYQKLTKNLIRSFQYHTAIL